MTYITLYPITGVMLGAELQTFEDTKVLVIDLLILRIMVEWGEE
jgi:hypothetical protein